MSWLKVDSAFLWLRQRQCQRRVKASEVSARELRPLCFARGPARTFMVPGDLIRPEECQPKWIILPGLRIHGLPVSLIHLAVGGLITQHRNGHRKVNISL